MTHQVYFLQLPLHLHPSEFTAAFSNATVNAVVVRIYSGKILQSKKEIKIKLTFTIHSRYCKLFVLGNEKVTQITANPHNNHFCTKANHTARQKHC